ncbi:MAG: glycosyl hydrolase-related protein, partial [bacterium]|nr:glycosyl hydrolase-related protein [bacterium]
PWRTNDSPAGGCIRRIYDKTHRVDVVRRACGLDVLEDKGDTWGHGITTWDRVVGRFGDGTSKLINEGPVSATLLVTSRFEGSQCELLVTLHRDVADLDVNVRVNWQGRQRMLKMAFETRIEDGEAWYETAYSATRRATDGQEVPAQQWMDLGGRIGGQPYGLAVLNDAKYGCSAKDDTLYLTVLRSPLYAFHDPWTQGDHPAHTIDQGWQSFNLQLLPHAGDWHSAGVPRRAWELNEPAFTLVEHAHAGPLPAQRAFFDGASDTVVVSVVKMSEDGPALIVRGYETAGQAATARLTVAGLPQPLTVDFAPYEIKTLRIDPVTGAWRPVDLLESPLA